MQLKSRSSSPAQNKPPTGPKCGDRAARAGDAGRTGGGRPRGQIAVHKDRKSHRRHSIHEKTSDSDENIQAFRAFIVIMDINNSQNTIAAAVEEQSSPQMKSAVWSHKPHTALKTLRWRLKPPQPSRIKPEPVKPNYGRHHLRPCPCGWGFSTDFR